MIRNAVRGYFRGFPVVPVYIAGGLIVSGIGFDKLEGRDPKPRWDAPIAAALITSGWKGSPILKSFIPMIFGFGILSCICGRVAIRAGIVNESTVYPYSVKNKKLKKV